MRLSIWDRLSYSFNSRTPGGVRPPLLNIRLIREHVSIHAPREGCDRAGDRGLETQDGFNSRTPGGVRRGVSATCNTSTEVSIHAPREGCDVTVWDNRGNNHQFQFTHPGRGATDIIRHVKGGAKFQFTHPGRGATPKRSAA